MAASSVVRPRRPRDDVIEKLLAGIVLALCVGLFVRMLLPPWRRVRLDAWLGRCRATLRRRALAVWHWRRTRREARRAADEAIRRARGAGVERDGNVYKPKSFRKPPRDKMH